MPRVSAGCGTSVPMNGNLLFTVRDSILVGRGQALHRSLLKRLNKAAGGWRLFLDLSFVNDSQIIVDI